MPASRLDRVLLLGVLLVAALSVVFRTAPTWDWVAHGGPLEEGDLPRAIAADADPAEAENGIPAARLLGVDAWLHLRHARYTAEAFPRLLREDAWTNYPYGYRVRETGLFGWGMGATAWALGLGDPSEALLQWVVAWTPVVLGVVVHLLLALLAHRLFGRGAGLLAVSLLLLYPGNFALRSVLGFSDHHVAEAVLLLATMLGVSSLLPRAGPTDGEDPPDPTLKTAALAALPLLLFHFAWVGAPMWLLTVGVTLLAAAAVEVGRGRGEAFSLRVAAYGLAFTLPFALITFAVPDLSMVPGLTPQILAMGLAIGLGIPLWTRAVAWLGGRLQRPALAAVGSFVATLGAAVGILASSSTGRWAWETLTGERTSLVVEHVPFSWTMSWVLMGPPALLVPIATLVLLWKARRTEGLRQAVLLLPAYAFFFFWISTTDFGYLAAPMVALVATPLLLTVGRSLVERGTLGRVALAAAGLVLVFIPLSGSAAVRQPWTPGAGEALLLADDPLIEMAHWFRTSTPDPRDDPPTGASSVVGEGGFDYGVLVAWDYGNLVSTLGGRPVRWSQGPLDHLANWFLAQSESEAEERLQRELSPSLRYVVVDAETIGTRFRGKFLTSGREETDFVRELGNATIGGQRGLILDFEPAFSRSMLARLYLGNGSELEGYRLRFESLGQSLTGYVAAPVPGGLEVQRITREVRTVAQQTESREMEMREADQIMELDGIGLFDMRIAPTVRVFERVRGAVLTGVAEPNRRVRATIQVYPRPGRLSFTWTRTVRTDAEGRWTIRAPYPSGVPGERSEVHTRGPYSVFLLPESEPGIPTPAELLADDVTVTEGDVRNGREVPVETNSPASPD